MTTQAQVVASQALAMLAQANREVGPRVQTNASITTSCLRDFMRTNPPMFYGSKVNEDPRSSFMRYKIFFIPLDCLQVKRTI